MFDEILQYIMTNASTTLQAGKWYLPTVIWQELLGLCQIRSWLPQCKGDLMGILNIERAAKYTKLARLLPEGQTSEKDVTARVCLTKLTACCFKWLMLSGIISYLQMAMCLCPCVCVCSCMPVCIIMDLPALNEKHFTLGKPSAETDLHHSSWV